ncbi:MAG TPA: Hsp20/alpha crystallin family protein [Frankiaceae bacterium]|nr:Hsp20/alpha crystallin family protein [Frankiaceae bacterium]
MPETRPARQRGRGGITNADPLSEMRRLLGADDDLLRTEEYRQEGDLVLRVEAPGIDPEKDVDIRMEDDMLTVAVERREETTEATEEKAEYHSEFRYGSLSRSMRLPRGTRSDRISATYIDGILTVRIPLRGEEQTTAQHVPVQRN